MVQRVNFIEKGAYALTYRNMIVFAGAVVVLCFLVHGLFLFRFALVKSKTGELKQQIQELSLQKDKTMAAMQIAQVHQTNAATPLASVFSKVPIWSTVLEGIVEQMPKQIWLEHIRSANIGEKIDVRRLEVTGKGVSHASIAQFVRTLDESDLFENTVLVGSQKDKAVYTFLVNTDVTFPKAEW